MSDALAARLGHRLAVETLLPHGAAHDLGERWARLGAEQGWTDEQTERVAFNCAAIGMPPEAMTGLLPLKPIEAPPCYRCGGHIDDHGLYETLTCGSYVWPGGLVAAAIDLHRAVRDLLDEAMRPFRELAERVLRRPRG